MIKTPLTLYAILISFALFFNCNDDDTKLTENVSTDNTNEDVDDVNSDGNNDTTNLDYKILALGDSYTIGQSVCETCRFPAQLKDSLTNRIDNSTFNLEIIAQTGWTTSALKSAINSQNLTNDRDLVTLLIGVNNQYQGRPFSLYEQEFPELVDTAIYLAKGRKSNVIVVSIPDYAFTPFGNGNIIISEEIDDYNSFAENYCAQNNITYIFITDITRQGLSNSDLVASDGLHPSEIAYSKFVERILPDAILKIQQ